MCRGHSDVGVLAEGCRQGAADYFGGGWLSEAANSVLVPAFWSLVDELLAGVVVNSSALFTGSALLATVSAADFSPVSAVGPVRVMVPPVAPVLVSALARCLGASLRSKTDRVAASALWVPILSW